jgi:hypothetical protein
MGQRQKSIIARKEQSTSTVAQSIATKSQQREPAESENESGRAKHSLHLGGTRKHISGACSASVDNEGRTSGIWRDRMMIDTQEVLHHICHVSHAYRGQVQVVKTLRTEGENGFLCCIDLPDSQLTNMHPVHKVQPLIATIRQRINKTHPDVVVEALDAQRYPMPNETFLYKLFLRVSAD